MTTTTDLTAAEKLEQTAERALEKARVIRNQEEADRAAEAERRNADRLAADEARLKAVPEAGKAAREAWDAFLDAVRNGTGEITAYINFRRADLHRVAEHAWATHHRDLARSRAYETGAETYRQITEAYGIATTASDAGVRAEWRARLNGIRRETEGLSIDDLPDNTPEPNYADLDRRYFPGNRPIAHTPDAAPRFASFADAIDAAVALILDGDGGN